MNSLQHLIFQLTNHAVKQQFFCLSQFPSDKLAILYTWNVSNVDAIFNLRFVSVFLIWFFIYFWYFFLHSTGNKQTAKCCFIVLIGKNCFSHLFFLALLLFRFIIKIYFVWIENFCWFFPCFSQINFRCKFLFEWMKNFWNWILNYVMVFFAHFLFDVCGPLWGKWGVLWNHEICVIDYENAFMLSKNTLNFRQKIYGKLFKNSIRIDGLHLNPLKFYSLT